MSHPPILLTVDGRKRLSLGALVRFGHLHGQYLASMSTDGTIVLTPAVVLTLERSHELHRNEKILRSAQVELLVEPPF